MAATLVTLASCDRAHPGLTLSWFRTETTGPLVIAPHVLEVGSKRQRAYLRGGAGWAKVYDGPAAGILVLDRDRAVVLKGPRKLFREDVAEGTPLDAAACTGAAVAATHEGDRIVCVEVRSGSEPVLSLAQLDARGRVLRSDRATGTAEHRWAATTADPESWEILGFTREWDPVLALRSAERPSRFDVHVLGRAGPVVLDGVAFDLEPGGRIHSQDTGHVTARLGPLVGVYWSSYGRFTAAGAQRP